MTGFFWQLRLEILWYGSGMPKLESTVGSATWGRCSESNRTPTPHRLETFYAPYIRKTANSSSRRSLMPNEAGSGIWQNFVSFARTERSAGSRLEENTITQRMAILRAWLAWQWTSQSAVSPRTRYVRAKRASAWSPIQPQ